MSLQALLPSGAVAWTSSASSRVWLAPLAEGLQRVSSGAETPQAGRGWFSSPVTQETPRALEVLCQELWTDQIISHHGVNSRIQISKRSCLRLLGRIFREMGTPTTRGIAFWWLLYR